MFCPGCGAEFDPGGDCGECQVVDRAPDMAPHFQDTVSIFESDDQGEMASESFQGAKSLRRAKLVGAEHSWDVLSSSMIASIDEAGIRRSRHAALGGPEQGVSADDIDQYYDDDEEQPNRADKFAVRMVVCPIARVYMECGGGAAERNTALAVSRDQTLFAVATLVRDRPCESTAGAPHFKPSVCPPPQSLVFLQSVTLWEELPPDLPVILL